MQKSAQTRFGCFLKRNLIHRKESMTVTNKKAERKTNIELLRILAIMGVIVLHYNNRDIGRALEYVIPNSLNYYLLVFLEAVSICSVDLFFIISGYFMANSNRRSIRKPIELIVQVIVYSVAGYCLGIVMTHKALSVTELLFHFIPANYFVIFYSILYFLSPFVNKMLRSIDGEGNKRLLFLSVLFFSVYCTLVQLLSNIFGKPMMGLDPIGLHGSDGGYNIVNFGLMYIIGAYIQMYGIAQKYRNRAKLLAVLLTCIVLLVIWGIVDDCVPGILSKNAWIYCNPIVILEATVVFLLFLNLNIRHNRVINAFAASAFSVFLLHGYLITRTGIERFAGGNAFLMLAHLLGVTIVIYAACTLVHYIYRAVTVPMFNHLFNHCDLHIVDME